MCCLKSKTEFCQQQTSLFSFPSGEENQGLAHIIHVSISRATFLDSRSGAMTQGALDCYSLRSIFCLLLQILHFNIFGRCITMY